MKSLNLIALIALFSPLMGCSSAGPEAKEISSASYEPNNVINRQKADFIWATDQHLNEVEKKIDRWKVEAKEASGTLKEDRYDRITTLEKQLDNARMKLNKLKTASTSQYKDCKEDVEEAVEDLDEEFQETMEDFK